MPLLPPLQYFYDIVSPLPHRVEVLVRRHDLVHQSPLLRLDGQPRLPGRDRLDVIPPQLGPRQGDVILERVVYLLELLLELRLPLLGHLAERIDGPLVPSRRERIRVDVVPVEETVKVGNLGQNSDAPHDREGGGIDDVGDADHHVPPGRGDRIDARHELDPRLADAHQLGRGQTVGGNFASGGRHRDHGLVHPPPSLIDHEGYLLPQ
mmetsp:Transcript_40053/g.120691  ORF Transcript_40053/g.120691 Transcript_40053/m.120691 type:complete len:208 (-) Transcript_40053:348-971(-)